jgi:hypothetical protein
MSYLLSIMSFKQGPIAPLQVLKMKLVSVSVAKYYVSKISHRLYISCQIKYEKQYQ